MSDGSIEDVLAYRRQELAVQAVRMCCKDHGIILDNFRTAEIYPAYSLPLYRSEIPTAQRILLPLMALASRYGHFELYVEEPDDVAGDMPALIVRLLRWW